MSRWMTLLASFGTGGTLICCVLPTVLVLMGAGSTLVFLTSAFPWLVTLSEHKEVVFVASAVILGGAWYALVSQWNICPADPELGRQCMRRKKQSLWVLGAATVLQLGGAFYSLALPVLLGLA